MLLIFGRQTDDYDTSLTEEQREDIDIIDKVEDIKKEKAGASFHVNLLCGALAKPLAYTFNVRVPNYAQKTGKRLFIQPGFFEHGTDAVFSAAARVNQIYFPYPWSENDEVEIRMPSNFALDNADAPAAIEDPDKFSSLRVSMQFDKAINTLKYQRKFHFGGGNNILFPVTAYQALKTLFDEFYKADNHTITLKQN